MQLTCLVEQLTRYCSLSADEIATLESLVTGHRVIRRNSIVRAERSSGNEMFVVQSGWLFCSTLLEDGRRQIIRFHFRGDVLGGDTIGFGDSADTITALTDAEICLIDRDAFGRLFVDQPRLGALLYAMLQIEQVSLTDRLTSLGRSSAKGRLAALLLWVVERLRLCDSTQDYSFTLPMTQEEIGDATGLTAVHVNRTLRAMEEQGLIERTRNALRLIDPERLARIANQPVRKPRVAPGFLPPLR